MLKKRIIGVITVLGGRAVQSIGYNSYLPLGSVRILAENLDHWAADEILIQCIDRTGNGLGPDFELIKDVSRMDLRTPIAYGGGIRSADDAIRVTNLGIERVVIDALVWTYPQGLYEFANTVGSQAVIAVFPMTKTNERRIEFHNYRTKENNILSSEVTKLLDNRVISEVMIVDHRNEGGKASFDFDLLDAFEGMSIPKILFGGITTAEMVQTALEKDSVSAVGIGNSLNYTEHSVRHLKSAVSTSLIRPHHLQKQTA